MHGCMRPHTYIHTDSDEYSTVAFSKNATLTTYDMCNTQDCCLVVLEKFFEDFCTYFFSSEMPPDGFWEVVKQVKIQVFLVTLNRAIMLQLMYGVQPIKAQTRH